MDTQNVKSAVHQSTYTFPCKRWDTVWWIDKNGNTMRGVVVSFFINHAPHINIGPDGFEDMPDFKVFPVSLDTFNERFAFSKEEIEKRREKNGS